MKFRVFNSCKPILKPKYCNFPNLSVTQKTKGTYTYSMAILEVNSLEELKKYYEYVTADLIIDFLGSDEDEPTGLDGHIEIYDDYME